MISAPGRLDSILAIRAVEADDHTPSRTCRHVGAEVEGVLGVNQMPLSQQLLGARVKYYPTRIRQKTPDFNYWPLG